LLRCIAFPLTIKRLDRIPLWRRLRQSKPVRELLAGLRRMQLRRRCIASRDTLTAEDWFDLFYRQYSPMGGDMFSYFFYRLAQPRHLAALVLTSYLPASEKPLLDLACGFGHLGYNLAESPAAHSVVGVDRNFFQLWTAQYWIAPKNRFVCADADQPLPFADASFAATLCSDAFHCFRRKDLTLREIARCAPEQPVLLTRTGNSLVQPNEGFELTPEEYLALGNGPAWRLFGENELLDCYLRREPLDLSAPRNPTLADGEKWVSLVYPGSPPVMKRSNSTAWPHAMGRLGINPIYQAERQADGSWSLQFRFPSHHYAFENARMAGFCPQSATLTEEAYRDMKANVHSPEVERLIEQMVIIAMPDRYARRQEAFGS
jgi:SAM-dependent methyltransferase